jgi:hypothetical protein
MQSADSVENLQSVRKILGEVPEDDEDHPNEDLIERLKEAENNPEARLQYVPGNENCNLCFIPREGFREYENILFRRKGKYSIVEAATDKGHNTRIMAVPEFHQLPEEDWIQKYGAEMMMDLIIEGTKWSNKQMNAVYAGMNNFDHPHIIFTSLHNENPREDLYGISNATIVEQGNVEEPQAKILTGLPQYTENWGRIGDKIGEVYMQPFMEVLEQEVAGTESENHYEIGLTDRVY